MLENDNRIFAAKKKINLLYANQNVNIGLRYAKQLEERMLAYNKKLTELYLDLKRKKPDFFNQFDYDWFLNTELFSDGWERNLQLKILTILSDVRPNYEKASRFGNIAVIFVNSESYFAESRVCDEIKFIIISTPLKRLLGNYVWYLSELYEYGKKKDIKDDFGCCKILSELHNDPIVVQKTMSFLGTIFKAAKFETSSAFAPDISAKVQVDSFDPNYHLLHSTMELVELYIITHELAHLIDESYGEKRSLDLEIATDISANSLNIINIANSNSSRISFAMGPVIFFEFSILFMLIRSILYSSDPNTQGLIRDNDIKELVARRDIYINHIKHHYILEEFVNIYKVVSTKFRVQFEFIQKIMFEKIK